jgi:hypothetical protein
VHPSCIHPSCASIHRVHPSIHRVHPSHPSIWGGYLSIYCIYLSPPSIYLWGRFIYLGFIDRVYRRSRTSSFYSFIYLSIYSSIYLSIIHSSIYLIERSKTKHRSSPHETPFAPNETKCIQPLPSTIIQPPQHQSAQPMKRTAIFKRRSRWKSELNVRQVSFEFLQCHFPKMFSFVLRT